MQFDRLLASLAMFLVAASAELAAAQRTASTDPRWRPVEPVDQPEPRAGEAPAGAPREEGHTAASVARAPAPHEATGVARREPESPANRLRVVPRVVLFVPRMALAVVQAPVRGTLWAYERYGLRDRWRAVFFNDTGTIGLYPTARIESDFGFGAGARFMHRDLLGDAERLSAGVHFGGRYSQRYAAALDSGDRFGERFRLELDGEHEVRPKDKFYGIGNADTVEAPAAPVDPYEQPVAISSRFGQTVSRVAMIGDLRLVGPLRARLSGAVSRKLFHEGDPARIREGQQITDNYDVSALPGWEQGAAYGYGELELRYDTRRPYSRYEIAPMPSTGLLVSGFAGMAAGLSRAPTDYVRYGADVQQYIRLGERPRAIVLRGVVEAVAGDLDEIPFVDLPRLGGDLLLRGYPQDRFRDRALALASAEYQWDLAEQFGAFVFLDAGRVVPSLAELSAEDLRVGYGGGLQIQSVKSFLGRMTIGSSIDGGVTFALSFDPVYDPKARVERK